MTHRFALEVLDATMKDIFKNGKFIGGVTVALSEDFGQTLSVIPRGTKAYEINESMFKDFDGKQPGGFILQVTQEVKQFSKNLFVLGNGELTAENKGLILLENVGNILTGIEELTDRAFPNIENSLQ